MEMLQTPEKISEDWRNSVKAIVATGKKLTEIKKTAASNALFMEEVRRLDVTDTAASKLIQIAAHPILSDPANASKLPAEWGKLYELRLLPDDKLSAMIADGSIMTVTKYDVWRMRGFTNREITNKSKDRRGVPSHPSGTSQRHLKPPEGLSISEWVSRGIRLEERHSGAEAAAKEIGMNLIAYTRVRTILLAIDRVEDGEERNILVDAMRKINKEHQYGKAYEKVRPILDRVRGKERQIVPKREYRARDKFLRAVHIIGDTCAIDLTVPYMPMEDINKAEEVLEKAEEDLSKLMVKLASARRETKR